MFANGDGVHVPALRNAIQFGYNSKCFDTLTGAYDYGFRNYRTELGRWTTIDPIKDGPNWYMYVGNDPVNFIDPLGLSEIYTNDINGNAVVAYEGRDLKEAANLVITRGDNGTAYPDALGLRIGNQVITQVNAETEPTRDSAKLIDFSLPIGDTYIATLTNRSTFYEYSFRISSKSAQGPIPLAPGIPEEYGFMLHPDTITKENPIIPKGTTFDPPIGDGCGIPRLDDFNQILNDTGGLGFKLEDALPLSITEKEDKCND